MTAQRVLMTVDTVGGVWTFALELARGLLANGCEVCLATLGRKSTRAQQREIAAIRGLMWFDGGFKVEWMEDPWDDVSASTRWLEEIARGFNPDIVHLNTLGHSELTCEAPTILTVHSDVLSWWSAVKPDPLPDSWSRYRSEVEKALTRASFITIPSKSALAGLVRHFSFDSGRTRVVYNGRGHTHFHIAPKQPFVLSAGRLWDEAKNIVALARVAGSLPWRVYLAGDTGLGTGEAGSDWSGCVLLGLLSPMELADAYARATIYALPAKYEPFGLSVLEAALSGCALVLGDIPSLREIWDGCAVFVVPDDSAQLLREIQKLIESPASRERLAGSAYKRAREFTPERTTSAYLDVYRAARESRRQVCAL